MEGVHAHIPAIDFTGFTGLAPADVQAYEETGDRGDRPVHHGELRSEIINGGARSDHDGPQHRNDNRLVLTTVHCPFAPLRRERSSNPHGSDWFLVHSFHPYCYRQITLFSS